MGFGKIFQALSEMPAGIDQYALFTMFENGDSWAQMVAFDYRGGDAGEGLWLYLVPPNQIQDGTKAPQNVPGCIAAMNAMTGGDGSINVPSPYSNYRAMTFQPFLIPPNYSLAVQNASASNANPVFMNFLYVELTE